MDFIILSGRIRKEHEQILRFSKTWEDALDRLASDDAHKRSGGLTQLRALEKYLIEVREHCRAEEESRDSPFRVHLGPAERAELQRQHELLERRISDFANELLFASADRADELLRLGKETLEQLRHHIVFEEALLERLEQCPTSDFSS